MCNTEATGFWRGKCWTDINSTPGGKAEKQTFLCFNVGIIMLDSIHIGPSQFLQKINERICFWWCIELLVVGKNIYTKGMILFSIFFVIQISIGMGHEQRLLLLSVKFCVWEIFRSYFFEKFSGYWEKMNKNLTTWNTG